MAGNKDKDVILKVRGLGLNPVRQAAVEIIVPYHGQYDRVARLVTSIYRGTHQPPFRLTLVDDASPNDEFRQTLLKEVEKKKVENLQIIRNRSQLGFGGSLKAGFDHTEHPWICFLNSDCQIEDVNWLRALYLSYENLKGQRVKMISARMDRSAGGDQRVVGTQYTKTKDMVIDATVEEIVEKDCYVPLVCTMCHRDLFSKIGGFVKDYPYGMYEDVELACRMNAYGFKQGISGGSWVRHDGGGTIVSLMSSRPELKKVVDGNFNRCLGDIKRFV